MSSQVVSKTQREDTRKLQSEMKSRVGDIKTSAEGLSSRITAAEERNMECQDEMQETSGKQQQQIPGNRQALTHTAESSLPEPSVQSLQSLL